PTPCANARINLETTHPRRKLRQASRLSLRESVLEGDIFPLNPSKLAQLLPKRVHKDRAAGAVPESRKPMRATFPVCCPSTEPQSAKSMAQSARTVIFLSIFFSLFCARHSTFAPSHLITLSALASTFGGFMRPICLAFFRLMTNSNFIVFSTGRSEGFALFRILSTTDATRWFLSGASYPYDMSPPASTSVRLLNIAGSRFLRRAR